MGVSYFKEKKSLASHASIFLILCILYIKEVKMKYVDENNRLSSFYRERFCSFTDHLSVAKKTDEEIIHKLRVDVKNIRSLLLLLIEFNHETNVGTKLLKQLKKIFNSSGKLRALQVSKLLLLKSSVDIPVEMMAFLESELNEHTDKFRESLSQFDLPKFKERVSILCSSLNNVNTLALKMKVDSIIHDELEIVNKLFNSSRGEEYHHTIRKLLKLIKTLQQLLVSLKEDEGRRQALDIVNSTEIPLGNWHDNKVFDDFLIKLDMQLPDTNSQRILRNLKNQNNKSKMEMKSESDKYLRNHF